MEHMQRHGKATMANSTGTCGRNLSGPHLRHTWVPPACRSNARPPGKRVAQTEDMYLPYAATVVVRV